LGNEGTAALVFAVSVTLMLTDEARRLVRVRRRRRGGWRFACVTQIGALGLRASSDHEGARRNRGQAASDGNRSHVDLLHRVQIRVMEALTLHAVT
jgi:hypothetical protein